MSLLDLNRLKFLAFNFRKAIEATIVDVELQEMSTFPRGCCSFASDLLQRYLFEQGIESKYMSGRLGYGWHGESHAWLETADGIVIDITGDQYTNNKHITFNTSVYVGTRNDGFHNRFILDSPVIYSENFDPKFIQRYNKVNKHLNIKTPLNRQCEWPFEVNKEKDTSDKKCNYIDYSQFYEKNNDED